MIGPVAGKILGAAMGIAAVGVVGVMLLAPRQVLEVRREGTEAPLMRLCLGGSREFSLWFLHSYDRAYVEEHYRLGDDGRMVLTRMRFKSCLNGQGFDRGTYRPLPNGSAELADMNREMDEIRFRLGSPDLANHTLIVAGRRLRLLDLAEAGDLISIRSAFRPAWQVLQDRP